MAAGWLNLDQTCGYCRNGGRYDSGLSPKMVFVRPLRRDARKVLSQPRMACKFYLHGVYRMTLVENDCKTLFGYLSEIDNPRCRRRRRYRLGSLLALSCAAVLCGARATSRSLSVSMRSRIRCCVNSAPVCGAAKYSVRVFRACDMRSCRPTRTSCPRPSDASGLIMVLAMMRLQWYGAKTARLRRHCGIWRATPGSYPTACA